MDFEKELNLRIEEVEKTILTFLPNEENYQKRIIEAMNYSVCSGGKRLRPLFIQETYRLFGGEHYEVIKPFMAALEMIHTYSLVHDDLPAMDNDEYRRGRKTTHAVYGEAMGILAGDALLNYAFETACKAFEESNNPHVVARALTVLSNKAGIYGMIGGQVVDVMSSEMELTIDKIEFIHRLKTSALIEAAMMIGAILAGASKQEVAIVEKAAGLIGFAFQIQDDVLDVTSTSDILGKPTHSDEKNHKTTYVTIVGIKQAQEDVKRYSKQAIELIGGLDKDNAFLEALISYLICRKK
ncbi:MAG: polyprenyl synthetase family protein [Velocimicrobium sp.]